MDIGKEEEVIEVKTISPAKPARRIVRQPERHDPLPLPIPDREPALVPAKVRMS